MKKWEYRAVNPDKAAEGYPGGQARAMKMLNDLGEEGWLLIRVSQTGLAEEWVMVREFEDSSGIDTYACGHEYSVDHGKRRRFSMPCPECHRA